MQIVYYHPGRPPSDPNMNNNNNNNNSNNNSYEETDHEDNIDQGADEGLDKDTESDNSPDSIIDNNNDGTGFGSGIESDGIGLGTGTDSSTSDDTSTAYEGDIDTDEVSTDESQHGEQDEHQVLEGATGGVPMPTTAETNVLAGGNSPRSGASSVTTGASQNASGRIARTTHSMHVQDGVHNSSPDHDNLHTDKDRKRLSDMEILARLPPSQPTNGNATALTECNADGCRATGISDCQGYCAEHFCNLYRQGKLDITPRFEDEIQPGEDEIQPGMLNLLLHEGRSAGPGTGACVQPPSKHHEAMRSAQCQDHGLIEGRSSSQGHGERHRRTSKVKCKSSMCKFAARETGYCGKCSKTNQLGAKPKKKKVPTATLR